jgi:hypothetical protein
MVSGFMSRGVGGGWRLLSSQFGASSVLVFRLLVVRGVHVIGISCKDSRTHLRLSLRWLWGCCGLRIIVFAVNFGHLLITLFLRLRGGWFGGVLWCFLFTVVHYGCCRLMGCTCGWGRYYCSICLLSQSQSVFAWFLSNWAFVV